MYCGISFSNSVFTHKTKPTWEHIINVIKIKGTDNIVLCCASCNSSKGSKLLEDWLAGKYCSTKRELQKKMLRRQIRNILNRPKNLNP
ncbi:MAG: HNH endonuclease [Bacteroidetes bacterium]|nr:HNH endonuclease [Bacteroidota bacterium]